jgi:hypothetical protein
LALTAERASSRIVTTDEVLTECLTTHDLRRTVPHCGMLGNVAETSEITVLQVARFKAEAMELIGAAGIEAVASYLSEHPQAGDVIPGAGGARKLRWAAKGKGKRGGMRIIYVYVVVAESIYLLRCYAKNVQTDLSAGELKQVRELTGRLARRKGVQ